jgi:hypothetical protein
VNVKLRVLTLQCRQSRELIKFSPHVSCFHGQISAGKSSIARLIDYCFGGDLERTPAITSELVSVQLSAMIGKYEVIFEREAKGGASVQVTWQSADNEMGAVSAPLAAAPRPIWGESVFNLSDLIFFLADIVPMKVRKSKLQEESTLVRLSFRDIFWYCYLEQRHLDSSFYELKDTFKRLKSRDAMRFIVGYYSDELNNLEIKLDDVTRRRNTKAETAAQIKTFLEQFGFATKLELLGQISKVEADLSVAKKGLSELRDANPGRHLTDSLRQQLRALSASVDNEEIALTDLDGKITELQSLKAELVTTKFKLAKAEVATTILSGVKFQACPSCGTDLDHSPPKPEGSCSLCGSLSSITATPSNIQVEAMRQDLVSRIDDLQSSIERHVQVRRQQLKKV